MLKVYLIAPDLHWSAGGNTATLLARGLAARQCEVRVGTIAPLPAELRLDRIPVDVLGPQARRDPRRLFQFGRALRRFQPHIVHTFQPTANLLGRLATWLTPNAAHFVSAHVPADDAWHGQHWLDRMTSRGSDRWLAPTTELRRRWETGGIPPQRFKVVPPGVDASALTAAESQAQRSRFGLSGAVPVILGPAPLLRRKGGYEAVWALDLMRFAGVDVELLLAGFGPELQRVRAFAKAIEIDQRVHFFPREACLVDLFAAADVVWIPSLAIDEPDLLLSAMLAGKPVVASNVSGIAEFLVDGETGLLVPPNDKPVLVRQTCRLLEDAALRARQGANARQAAGRSHAPDMFVNRILDLYRQV